VVSLRKIDQGGVDGNTEAQRIVAEKGFALAEAVANGARDDAFSSGPRQTATTVALETRATSAENRIKHRERIADAMRRLS
jgi:hypothetical protein